MNDVEMLKKYKELLDNNIITQEEFDEKKSKLLDGGTLDSSEEETVTENKSPKMQLSKKFIKRIIVTVGIIAVLVTGTFSVEAIVESKQQSTRAIALEEEIKPIMYEYGLYSYAVKYADNCQFEVYAEGFESLTNGEALSCLKKLERVSIADPCGDGEIDFGTTRVHPGLDVEYAYWRVSSSAAKFAEMYTGNNTTPGIYCDQYGFECVFEYEN